ncbi:MAG: UbiA family prenyltransferase [Chloroflexota bacterium]|nr:UbiA family prenyltransferase [Chloroflexota bacterium]
MKKTFQGLIKLTHFEAYFYFVIITTLLGVTSAKGSFDWQFFVLLPANWLAVGFAYMFNDIENAPNDALAAGRHNHNPISSGWLSPKTARISALLVAITAGVLFSLLGKWPMVFGLFSLLLGFLYTYRGTRLKNILLFDIISHCLLFAGLQFLVGYFTYSPRLLPNWIWPFSLVLSLSIFSILSEQIQNNETDGSQLQNTALFLGKRATHILMIIVLIICVFIAAVSLILVDIIPMWIFILGIALTSIFALLQLNFKRKAINRIGTQDVLLNSLKRAVALALLLQFIIPWINRVFNIKLF